jgi:Mg-chelatase subunit ChlD
MTDTPRSPRRWRLALGAYADRSLGDCLGDGDARIDAALDHVYGEAYRQRGVRRGLTKQAKGHKGGTEASRLSVPDWLGEMRTLFPRSVFDVVQGHAIARFGMTDILGDKQALAELDPNPALLAALMAFKGRADPLLAAKIREVARRVVEELTTRLRTALSRALSGARRPGATTGRRSSARDIAWAETIRRNLKHYDPARQVLIAEQLRFHGHVRRHLPWTIVMCIDQSGSMAPSVIYAAVMAAILGGLPAVTVKLVVFDTAVVDLSDRVGDPVDVLMAVQLGGGTDIGRALAYCEAKHVVQPERTIMVLVSDFCEGAAPGPLIATVRRLAGARVTLLGLAALDDAARPDYDRGMAEQLATAGMHVAALTPEHFVTWVAARIR